MAMISASALSSSRIGLPDRSFTLRCKVYGGKRRKQASLGQCLEICLSHYINVCFSGDPAGHARATEKLATTRGCFHFGGTCRMFREGFGGGNSMFRRCLAACAVL